MLNSPRLWLTRVILDNRVILINASSLVGTLIVTSGLGFAFWWVIAQLFPPAEAGLAAAAVSAMLLLGTIGVMGMGTLLIGELGRRPQIVPSLIATGLTIACVASVIFALLFLLIAPLFSDDFAIFSDTLDHILLFTVGVAITGMVLVLDQALLGLLMGKWQLTRNAIFASSKLILLFPAAHYFASGGTMTIYTTWLIGNLISLLPFFWLVGWHKFRTSDYRPQWQLLHELRGAALAHHILNLSLQTVQFSMPVIVAVMLSPEVNASFYVAWLIASSLFIVPTAMTQALYAVSAADVAILAQKIRFTLRMSFLGVILLGAFGIVAAEFILAFFNPTYALTATDSMRILLVAALPITVRAHYVAIYQVRRQVQKAAYIFVGAAILELSLAIAGAWLGGLTGLSIGWVVALYLQGVFMGREVYAVARVPVGDGDE
jgi:O-antigen/teichoic acid export membrane protein